MSFYVKRIHNGVTGWTGPIRSERQAGREADAWRAAGRVAEVLPTSPEVRAEVGAWDKVKKEAKR